MSIYKDNVTGKWRVVYRYTDWTGKTKQTSKRGFPTKREAQMWEHEQMLKHDVKLDMTFACFYEIYVEDKKERIRDNTFIKSAKPFSFMSSFFISDFTISGP